MPRGARVVPGVERALERPKVNANAFAVPTVVARVCLDMLRSGTPRREEVIGNPARLGQLDVSTVD